MLSDLKIDEKFNATRKRQFSLGSINGEWSENLYFNNEIYWWVKDHEPVTMTKMDFVLPSDSTMREDLNSLLNDDLTNAQSSKESLEEKQRHDRKLREKFAKKLINY